MALVTGSQLQTIEYTICLPVIGTGCFAMALVYRDHSVWPHVFGLVTPAAGVQLREHESTCRQRSGYLKLRSHLAGYLILRAAHLDVTFRYSTPHSANSATS